MKNAFKVCNDGKWKTKDGVSYDVKTVQMFDLPPEGYFFSLEEASESSLEAPKKRGRPPKAQSLEEASE